MTSTPSLVMRSPATVAARFESDCESLMMISIGCVWPSPHLTPSLTAAFHCSTQHWSVSPNAASGPVSGADEADLDGAAVAEPPPLPLSSLLLPQAASTPPRPPVAPRARPVTPAVLRKSRRVSGVLTTDSVRLAGLARQNSYRLLAWSRRLAALHRRRRRHGTPPMAFWSRTARTAVRVAASAAASDPSSRLVTGVLPPPWLSTIRTFPPTIRASYSRADWCQGGARPVRIPDRLVRRPARAGVRSR